METTPNAPAASTAARQQSLPDPQFETLAEAEAAFRRNMPDFATTQHLDDLRAREYGRLDIADHVYLDYTGAGLYADAQVRAHMDLLLHNVFGNPHSTSPTSLAATLLVEQARTAVLQFFSASPDEYEVIFTANASGALKLVGESYPFGPNSTFLLTFDNHNSVNGIREFARAKGARVRYTPVLLPSMRLDDDQLTTNLAQRVPDGHSLFAYPAQSNFSGVQHALDWIETARAQGWDVLLDAAAFAPTNPLDLSRWHPDFVTLSFYKMFGYPTGVGCLLARKATVGKLHRPWFAGGTITVASVQGDRYYLQQSAEAFEDGTLNYLGLPAIEIGLRHLQQVGMAAIHRRVHCLTDWLLCQLGGMQHRNGAPLVRIAGPTQMEQRGGTVTFNLFDANSHFIDHRLVEQRANKANISLRTGCFCNPGAGEQALGISVEELGACFVTHPTHMLVDDFRRCIDDKSTGAVRISVGLVSTFADVYRFVAFARTFLDEPAEVHC